jgi:catechol 2,3-dioxygenase-like lactoylglutathione lyase family enzyme
MADQPLRLDRVASISVFVFVLVAARRFYEETLGLAGRSDGDDYSTFNVGDVRLIIEPVEPTSEYALLVGRFTGFSFEVADVNAAYEELKGRGVVFLDPPERQPWGGVLAHFEDADENILTIVQEPKG